MVKQLLLFIRRPTFIQDPESLNFIESCKLVAKLCLVYFGLILLVSSLRSLILDPLGLFPKAISKYTNAPLSLKVMVMAPILEEILFRLPVRFSKYNYLITIGAAFSLIFHHVFNSYLSYVCMVVALVPRLGIIPSGVYMRMEFYSQKYFPHIFYALAVCFGLLHITNFNNLTAVQYVLSPVIVAPQIFLGLYLGTVRVKYQYGFVYGVLVHGLTNLPPLLIHHL